MDYKDIKKLMDDMGDSKLSEIEIEFPDGIKISMKKNNEKKEVSEVPAVVPINLPTVTPTQAVTVTNSSTIENADNKKTEGNIVKSPMVGTFYSKASPTSDSFVKKGSKVKKGDTLCIIEAMKLMNEIESEFDGEVVDILIHDEEMVEYGKPLFIIK